MIALISGAALAIGVSGCYFQPYPTNSNLAPVRGRVTVNGAPQAGIEVYFESLTARPSSGLTDADGRYELRFDDHHMGAAIGSHIVRLTRNLQPAMKPKPELPARYNKKSDLNLRVEPGENVFDFDVIDTPDEPAGGKTSQDKAAPN